MKKVLRGLSDIGSVAKRGIMGGDSYWISVLEAMSNDFKRYAGKDVVYMSDLRSSSKRFELFTSKEIFEAIENSDHQPLHKAFKDTVYEAMKFASKQYGQDEIIKIFLRWDNAIAAVKEKPKVRELYIDAAAQYLVDKNTDLNHLYWGYNNSNYTQKYPDLFLSIVDKVLSDNVQVRFNKGSVDEKSEKVERLAKNINVALTLYGSYNPEDPDQKLTKAHHKIRKHITTLGKYASLEDGKHHYLELLKNYNTQKLTLGGDLDVYVYNQLYRDLVKNITNENIEKIFEKTETYTVIGHKKNENGWRQTTDEKQSLPLHRIVFWGFDGVETIPDTFVPQLKKLYAQKDNPFVQDIIYKAALSKSCLKSLVNSDLYDEFYKEWESLILDQDDNEHELGKRFDHLYGLSKLYRDGVDVKAHILSEMDKINDCIQETSVLGHSESLIYVFDSRLYFDKVLSKTDYKEKFEDLWSLVIDRVSDLDPDHEKTEDLWAALSRKLFNPTYEDGFAQYLETNDIELTPFYDGVFEAMEQQLDKSHSPLIKNFGYYLTSDLSLNTLKVQPGYLNLYVRLLKFYHDNADRNKDAQYYLSNFLGKEEMPKRVKEIYKRIREQALIESGQFDISDIDGINNGDFSQKKTRSTTSVEIKPQHLKMVEALRVTFDGWVDEIEEHEFDDQMWLEGEWTHYTDMQFLFDDYEAVLLSNLQKSLDKQGIKSFVTEDIRPYLHVENQRDKNATLTINANIKDIGYEAIKDLSRTFGNTVRQTDRQLGHRTRRDVNSIESEISRSITNCFYDATVSVELGDDIVYSAVEIEFDEELPGLAELYAIQLSKLAPLDTGIVTPEMTFDGESNSLSVPLYPLIENKVDHERIYELFEKTNEDVRKKLSADKRLPIKGRGDYVGLLPQDEWEESLFDVITKKNSFDIPSIMRDIINKASEDNSMLRF